MLEHYDPILVYYGAQGPPLSLVEITTPRLEIPTPPPPPDEEEEAEPPPHFPSVVSRGTEKESKSADGDGDGDGDDDGLLDAIMNFKEVSFDERRASTGPLRTTTFAQPSWSSRPSLPMAGGFTTNDTDHLDAAEEKIELDLSAMSRSMQIVPCKSTSHNIDINHGVIDLGNNFAQH